MIDEEVEKLGKRFVLRFSKLKEKVKDYNFDFSFYSLNLLDLALDTRFTSNLDEEEQNLLVIEACSYLGLSIYGVWENISPSPEISLFLRDHPEKTIILSIKSEAYQAETEVSFDLTKIIKKALNSLSEDYFPTKDSIILAGEERRAISHAAFGIVTGMSSDRTGPWEYKNEADLSLFINQVSTIIGQDRLERINDINSVSIEKEILYPKFTLPPLGFKEQAIGKRLTTFILEHKLNENKQDWLRSIFKRSDFLLASAGYLYITSTDSSNDIYSAKDFSLLHPLWASAIRPMFLILREESGHPSWLKLVENSKFDAALLELRIESEYGLVPLINTLSLVDALNPRTILYFNALACGLINEAYILGRKLTMKKIVEESILFNQAYICYKLGKPEEALTLVDRLSESEILGLKLEVLIKKDYENLSKELLEKLLISYNENCWQFEAEFLITSIKIILGNYELNNKFNAVIKSNMEKFQVLSYSSELNFSLNSKMKVNACSPYSFWQTLINSSN